MPFSPKFTLTPRLQRQLVAIDMTRGFLQAVRLQEQWAATVRHEVRVEDSLASVQIEGSSLTLQEAFDLATDRAPQRQLRDSEREFLNYLRAFEAVDDLKDTRNVQLRPGDVRNLHRMLVEGVRGGDRYAGETRKEPVAVGDREGSKVVVHHQPPPWAEVDDHVRELMEWLEQVKLKPSPAQIARGVEDPWVHPVIVAGIAQHRFVWIHPFVDGNGRTARMLTTLLLFQRGYDFKYLFNLSNYYNQNRDQYYEALRVSDRTGDDTAWLEYFCGGLALQMYQVRQKAKKVAEAGDTDQVPASAPPTDR